MKFCWSKPLKKNPWSARSRWKNNPSKNVRPLSELRLYRASKNYVECKPVVYLIRIISKFSSIWTGSMYYSDKNIVVVNDYLRTSVKRHDFLFRHAGIVESRWQASFPPPEASRLHRAFCPDAIEGTYNKDDLLLCRKMFCLDAIEETYNNDPQTWCHWCWHFPR